MPEIAEVKRSRNVGLKDLYLAKITTNNDKTYLTETPIRFARAIKAKITDKFTVEKIYSDDGTEEVVESYEGSDVELEVNKLAPQDRAFTFGKLYEKGFLVSGADDKAPELALGFRVKQLSGKYEFVWYYCGKFGQGFENNYESQQGKKSPQTASLKGDFYERALDNKFNISVDESNLLESYTEAKTAISDWFSKVQENNTAIAEG